MIHDAAVFLEKNRICKKHHVEHTGSNAYLLDFYDFLDETEKGKELTFSLLDLIVDNPTGGRVFYPGHLNPMNMSQNVIDTGTAVDAIARFANSRREDFIKDEHAKIESSLRKVVESYLAEAAVSKKITNQRLWGLTGVASFAQYVGEEEAYKSIAEKSIDKAFSDMTADGFFRYFPNPHQHSLPYDSMTTFYQSRHTTFIYYTLSALGMDSLPYKDKLEKSTEALLSMYEANGVKDMRMECKRWYWLSKYEVASHSFDAYALSNSDIPETKSALHNVLFQVRKHFYNGFLHSHKGINNNFQCPIFWTAHLAWLTRIPEIDSSFENASFLETFSYILKGKEVFSQTSPNKRILVNSLLKERNPTTGIFENGLKGKGKWNLKIPKLPHAFLFSLKEVINHSWYALRGLHIFEVIARLSLFIRDFIVMILPYYSIRYGEIESIQYKEDVVVVSVKPASKYGTLLKDTKEVTISI